MPHELRVNFENFGHSTKNKIFRLVKLLADLSTRLKTMHCGWTLKTSITLQRIRFFDYIRGTGGHLFLVAGYDQGLPAFWRLRRRLFVFVFRPFRLRGQPLEEGVDALERLVWVNEDLSFHLVNCQPLTRCITPVIVCFWRRAANFGEQCYYICIWAYRNIDIS